MYYIIKSSCQKEIPNIVIFEFTIEERNLNLNFLSHKLQYLIMNTLFILGCIHYVHFVRLLPLPSAKLHILLCTFLAIRL